MVFNTSIIKHEDIKNMNDWTVGNFNMHLKQIGYCNISSYV
jgi:hypothetical protein